MVGILFIGGLVRSIEFYPCERHESPAVLCNNMFDSLFFVLYVFVLMVIRYSQSESSI